MRPPPVEVGALLLFLVALAITASFFFDSGEGPPRELPAISPGLPSGSVRPTPGPNRLPEPKSWFVTYFVEGENKTSPSHQGILEGLDLAYEAGPFGDVPDNSWYLVTEIAFELAPGRYAFTLEHDGALAISVDNQPVVSYPDPIATQRREVAFDHAGFDLILRIEARDTGGPFQLRWIGD